VEAAVDPAQQKAEGDEQDAAAEYRKDVRPEVLEPLGVEVYRAEHCGGVPCTVDYAGEDFSIQGATLRPDADANEEMYGKAIENRTILTTPVAPPPAAAKLETLLNRNSSRQTK